MVGSSHFDSRKRRYQAERKKTKNIDKSKTRRALQLARLSLFFFRCFSFHACNRLTASLLSDETGTLEETESRHPQDVYSTLFEKSSGATVIEQSVDPLSFLRP